MDELVIEGVRCFKDRQTIPIRPLTILVGENSAGKSTVLAMTRAAWDIAFGVTPPDFTEEPFDLGGYEAIAHYHGGRGKRVRQFCVQGTFPARTRKSKAVRTVAATFEEHAGQPSLSRWMASQDEMKIEIAWARDHAQIIGSGGASEGFDTKVELAPGTIHTPQDAFRSLISSQRGGGAKWHEHWELVPGFLYGEQLRPIASAPIRSKPERTYDPRRGTQAPEGSHVPMRLASLKASDGEGFDRVAADLKSYAKDANLFASVDVRRLGKKPGDPFQLHVAVDQHAFNLRDVGYGVSQVLPILVDTLTAPRNQTFLLQQPEVHLHPRAQAALGSLLLAQTAKGQRFIVETHSDHLVDRVRMDLRDRKVKRLPADSAVVLFFERLGGIATIHPMTFDDDGNLRDAPASYREFFLLEERRLLGL